MEVQLKLQTAMSKSMKISPLIGGFPYLAECLKQEGFMKNIWILPSGNRFYFTKDDSLVLPGDAVFGDPRKVPVFNKKLLIKILELDQNGKTSFPEFLSNAWSAGIVRYDIDFIKREVIYYGIQGESYTESYPKVNLL